MHHCLAHMSTSESVCDTIRVVRGVHFCRGDLAGGAQAQTQRAFNSAHVVILVVDAVAAAGLEAPMTRREVALATNVIREGRALLIALNKLDELPQDDTLEACCCLLCPLGGFCQAYP